MRVCSGMRMVFWSEEWFGDGSGGLTGDLNGARGTVMASQRQLHGSGAWQKNASVQSHKIGSHKFP